MSKLPQRPRRNFPVILIAVVAIIVFLLSGLLYSEWSHPLPADAQPTYVGGASCIECHRKEYELFQGSHHDLAMDVANEDTVRARFDGAEIEHYGVTSRVFRDGERFMVHTEGPDGQMHDYQVKMVFGCEPLQQYMVELKEPGSEDALGQYQVLRLSWDVENEKWFYLPAPDVDEKLEPGDPLHWTGITQRWNSNCAICHSTNLKKNYSALTNTYSTTFTDINVNCESCHGPGSLHVEIAKRRRFLWDRNHGYGLTRLKSRSNLPQIESCAPCHSRRTEIQAGHQSGASYDDFYSCQLLTSPMYHDDGQIRDEDYVYGSFIQSRMFHQGIRCTDCHDPHSARVKFDDNRLCTSCHQHPAGKYDTPAHHRHANGSAGARCVECHMPSTTYMSIDKRRDHSLRVPRPDLSVRFGTPNACTACHISDIELPPKEQESLTQYLDWMIAAEAGNETVATELEKLDSRMAAAFQQWYPDYATDRTRSKYYEELVIGKSDSPESDSILRKLAANQRAPGIFRASAIEVLSERIDADAIDVAIQRLKDEDPKVVAAAVRLLSSHLMDRLEMSQYSTSAAATMKELQDLVNEIGPTLTDESLLVRIETAHAISNIPRQLRERLLDSRYRPAFSDALEEYKQSLLVNNDLAGAHMMLGTLLESEGQFQKAEAAYRTAISAQNGFTGPRSNLAALLEGRARQLGGQLSQIRQPRELEAARKRIERLMAEAAEYRAEENRLLREEVQRSEGLPEAHGLYYRYGLSCYVNGDREQAEEYLLKAHQQQPETAGYLLALATLYHELNDRKAIPLVNQLIELQPDHPAYQRLREEILADSSKE